MKKIILLLLVSIFLCTALTSCFSIIRYSFDDELPDIDTNVDTNVPDDTTETLVNEVAPRLLRANVVVIATHYTMTERADSQGSGVVFHSDDKYIYILTNHHVVDYDGAKRSVYSVRDAYDNTHSATVIAKDAAYDLAVLRVAKSEATQYISVVEIAENNSPVETAIISVGNPGGVHNTISIGKIVYLKDISSDALNIAVLYHTAPLDHGSSGGGIFDSSGRLVGINYAVGYDMESGMELSFAVPVEEICAFLTENRLMPTQTN